MPHASSWNNDVPCWSKNRVHPVVTLIHPILILILSPTLTQTLPHQIPNLLWTPGDVDELHLPLAEGVMTRVLRHAVVCETTPVVPLHAVMDGMTRVPHPPHHRGAPEMTHAPRPHPRVVVLEATLARLLHAEADATLLVRHPCHLRRDKGMDEDISVVTLATGEMTGPLRLASGIWMGGIEAGGMADMNGGARMTIVKESEMSDLPEVIGAGGCLMRGRETMVAGDNSWLCRPYVYSCYLAFVLHGSEILYMQKSSIVVMCIPLQIE
jgi:hypothetical protein